MNYIFCNFHKYTVATVENVLIKPLGQIPNNLISMCLPSQFYFHVDSTLLDICP